jgi:hypothetical protein
MLGDVQGGLRLLCSGLLSLCFGGWKCCSAWACKHRVFVALCCFEHLDRVRASASASRVAWLVRRHSFICGREAARCGGRRICCPDGQCLPAYAETTQGQQLFCFHTQRDATLWALTVERALLLESWPAWLQAHSRACTIWHSPDTSSRWQRLFAGPRTSIAINEQRFATASRQPVRCLHYCMPL